MELQNAGGLCCKRQNQHAEGPNKKRNQRLVAYTSCYCTYSQTTNDVSSIFRLAICAVDVAAALVSALKDDGTSMNW
ncbi:uncharacterized protein G2W53_014702 [Senna tora]|uniref:Uncharacterized protein n=1 Tax=Senna tora TaxID=362788 RepID=A0A834WU71_9FABA|nr:uncharacterized protein G2W53_014702 [Senna tora]